eukprot:CAMPEP_0202477674 /NCGR_PEP_ID=MMETSP1360-20130828/94064_1 /ASSEMBLY_ACC=CAM_ASM_000848 /TAXON_ID=515479 /ORGANISM="Licmophora paradoxa, Strain CCMP2313" /LENGTH=199 /DNA_ID=CAMNT_0049104925 /DNA_START=206 /DNA_END=804 /DNA_ORIENTATION=+
MTIVLTPEQFFHLGLQLTGFPQETIVRSKKSTNKERLKDFFYATPKTMAALYRDIQDPNLGEAWIEKPDPIFLLSALYMLKKYPTKIAPAAFSKCNEKTALLRSWKYISAIQSLREKKIKWIFGEEEENLMEDHFDELFIVTVDGVHCRIFEPRTDPSSGWSLLETNYWIVKREKNEQMKTMIKSGKTVRDVDAIDNDE